MMLPLFLAIAAQEAAPPTKTELVCDVKACAPGKPFTVALHMSLPKGWHNYYSNPGESGMPTRILWSLPPGFVAGPIRWPMPKRVVIDTISNYIYEGDEWLLSTVTPPHHLASGKAAIGAKAEWLLCREACVSQSATLGVTVATGARAIQNPAGARRVGAARRALPTLHLPFLIAATLQGNSVKMGFAAPNLNSAGATFYAADPNFFGVELPSVVSVRGTYAIRVPLSKYANSKPKRLTGILSFPAQAKAFWVNVPVS